MTIRHTILGFLSWRSLSGYDLKKLFVETPFIYWSGNNNQIYRTLLQLREAGWVISDVKQPESGPARKVYTITETGQTELTAWLRSAPELPHLKHNFLIQLAWADTLSDDELADLLAQYERAIRVQVLMVQEQIRRKNDYPARTGREARLWQAIRHHRQMFFEQELAWLAQLRQDLGLDD